MNKFYKLTTQDQTIHYGIFQDFTMKITEDEQYVSKVSTDTESGIIAQGGIEITETEYNDYLYRIGHSASHRPK